MDFNEAAVFVKEVQAGSFSAGLAIKLAGLDCQHADFPTGKAPVHHLAAAHDTQVAEWQGRADPIHLVHPGQRFMPPRLRAFIDLAQASINCQ